MLELLDAEPSDDVTWLVELGLNHEQQHQELLLMDIKHVLAVNPLQPAYRQPRPNPRAGTAPPLGWIEHDGGLVEIGHVGEGFSFDNETPRHVVHLAPFALADRPVTCGDWVAFIDDDGYHRPDLWLSDGWGAVMSERWEAPQYWSHDGGGWEVFTLTGPRPLDSDEPVCHVSYYEAEAFAHWSGARLPTEAEWTSTSCTRARPQGRLCSATCGSGPRRRISRIRVSGRRPERWASTTASSW